MTSPKSLALEIASLESYLRSKKAALDALRAACRHEWGPIKYDPVIRPAYRDPGDTPGTMGVDFRGPQYVPESRTDRWTRTCLLCDETEVTTSTEDHVIKSPTFT